MKKKRNSDPVWGHIAMEITLWQYIMICGSKETTFFFLLKERERQHHIPNLF